MRVSNPDKFVRVAASQFSRHKAGGEMEARALLLQVENSRFPEGNWNSRDIRDVVRDEIRQWDRWAAGKD